MLHKKIIDTLRAAGIDATYTWVSGWGTLYFDIRNNGCLFQLRVADHAEKHGGNDLNYVYQDYDEDWLHEDITEDEWEQDVANDVLSFVQNNIQKL